MENTLPNTTLGMEVEINLSRIEGELYFPESLFLQSIGLESSEILEIRSSVLNFPREEKVLQFFAFLEKYIYKGDYKQKSGEHTIYGESNHLHLNLSRKGYSNALRLAMKFNPMLSREEIFRDTLSTRAKPCIYNSFSRLPKESKSYWATINRPIYKQTLEFRINENPMILPFVILVNSLRGKRVPAFEEREGSFLDFKDLPEGTFHVPEFYNYNELLSLLDYSIDYCKKHKATHYSALQEYFVSLLPSSEKEALANWNSIITKYAKYLKDYYEDNFGELSFEIEGELKWENNFYIKDNRILNKKNFDSGISIQVKQTQ